MMTTGRGRRTIDVEGGLMKRLGQWLAIVGLILSLSGCGSLHLYSKEADVAATSAKTDYDASKVTEAIQAEGAMLDGLDAKEIEAFRKVTLAERNLELLSLVNESGTSAKRTTANGLVPRFRQLADARLVALNGAPAKSPGLLKELSDRKGKLRDAETGEMRARGQLLDFNARFASLPPCNKDVAHLKADPSADAAAALTKDADFRPDNLFASGTWSTAIANLGAACSDLLDARAAMDASLKKANAGQVGRAMEAAKVQESLLRDSQADASAQGTALQSAAKALADAQKAVQSASQGVDLTCDLSKPVTPPAAGADEVQKAKSALCEALAKLTNLGDFGARIIAQERLARINTVLAALSGIEPADGDPPLEPSLALLGASSRFAQALKQYQAAKTLPALEPLLIEKQLAAAQLAYAQAGVALSQARVRHAQAYRDATFLEVDLLVKAEAELGALGAVPAADTDCTKVEAVFCASMNQLLTDKTFSGGPGESASRRAYRAMALLSESYSVARDRQLTAELSLIDTDYRDSMLRSNASIAAWNALISVPVDQLKAYHADGWTPQEMAQLLQAFGVVGVAARIK
jgi:hypothetical protein